VRFTAEAHAVDAYNGVKGRQPALPAAGASPAAAHAGMHTEGLDDGARLYGRELFHGPAFAALRAVEQVGERGAAAVLVGSATLGWPQDGWRSDPALLDGALQLARVWGYTVLDRPTLPTACERLTIWRPGLFDARPLRCVVEGKPIGQAGTRSDLWLIDPTDDTVVAEIQGLEMYVSSDGKRTLDAV
jgi:hypothetical protein